MHVRVIAAPADHTASSSLPIADCVDCLHRNQKAKLLLRPTNEWIDDTWRTSNASEAPPHQADRSRVSIVWNTQKWIQVGYEGQFVHRAHNARLICIYCLLKWRVTHIDGATIAHSILYGSEATYDLLTLNSGLVLEKALISLSHLSTTYSFFPDTCFSCSSLLHHLRCYLYAPWISQQITANTTLVPKKRFRHNKPMFYCNTSF